MTSLRFCANYAVVVSMQAEIQRQADIIRSMDEQQDVPFSNSRPYFSALSLDNAPVSPHQLPQDDSRRTPLGGRQNFYKPPVPSHLSITPRRYGSIGGAAAQSSPGSNRGQAPPHPPAPHPLSEVSSPPTNLPRRHTSADIRSDVPGVNWQNNSPFQSGQNSTQWPSSPKRAPTAISEDQRIRESFSSYSLTNASSNSRTDNSRPTTPPFSNGSTMEHLNSWSWSSGRDKSAGNLFSNNSGPPTRRGSMAHILNPAETAEREEEHEEELREDDRKRKRLQ